MFDPCSLHKMWKWLGVCVNEATIDFHHVSAAKLRNTSCRNITQRWVSWSVPVVPEYRSKPKQGQRRVKNGQCRGEPNRSFVFSTLPLFLFVYSASNWENSEMLTLKTSLATYCQNHRYDHYFFHMFEAWVVVWGVFTKLRFG